MSTSRFSKIKIKREIIIIVIIIKGKSVFIIIYYFVNHNLKIFSILPFFLSFIHFDRIFVTSL